MIRLGARLRLYAQSHHLISPQKYEPDKLRVYSTRIPASMLSAQSLAFGLVAEKLKRAPQTPVVYVKEIGKDPLHTST